MGKYQYETGTIIGKGGIELFFQRWIALNPAAALVVVHGLGEHSGRYGNLINWLDGKRISIYALDHRGHGRSAGKRGHVDSFYDYVIDLSFFVESIKGEFPTVPIFLLGHSMGAIIAVLYALRHKGSIHGLILSSPAFTPIAEATPAELMVASFLSKYFPTMSISNKINANYLSHHRETVAEYQNDPLVHDRISIRWYTEFVKSAQECLTRANELTIPILIFHGIDDRIVDFSGSIQFFDSVSSLDKTKLLFEGLYHETMNEVEHEREKVLAAISKWILTHCVRKTAPIKKNRTKSKTT
ncbi:MAG: lysophospholipase [Spirochaetes bacterium]|nr:lysophospholipase [Spirochaetota bacterium]